MDPVSEAGKTADTYISALKNQPVLLVQSLIIAGIVFILYVQETKSFSERDKLLQSVFQAQTSVRDLLSKCVVPNGNKINSFEIVPR